LLCIEVQRSEQSMFSCTWRLQQMAAIVSYLCIVKGTAPFRPLTILPQICTVRGTKLRQHFIAIMEVFYCFTVAIGSPGDASNLVVQEVGVQAPPKSFDLLKILAKSLKIWVKSLKIWAKTAPNVCRKTQIRPFFRGHTKNRTSCSLQEKMEKIWATGAQKLFGQVWGNSGKNPSHPQTFACSYTYDKTTIRTKGRQLQRACKTR